MSQTYYLITPQPTPISLFFYFFTMSKDFLAETRNFNPKSYRMKSLFVLLLSLFSSSQLLAQSQVTNLYMFDLHRSGDTTFTFSKPRFLTNFNARGYNNHPFFANPDEIYFSSQEPGQDQPDILRFTLRDTVCAKITDTWEGEYSPRRAPFEYGNNLNLIRMEFSGKDTLIRLWQINNASFGGFGSRPLFQDLTNVGYYEWIRPGLIALHLNGSPNSLAIAIPETNNVALVSQRVGRCFKMAPSTNALIFLQKGSGGNHQLMALDMNTYAMAGSANAVPLIAPLPGKEDFAVLRDGTLLMAQGSQLFKYKPGLDLKWQPIADFSEHQLTNISRIEVSSDNSRIIFVN